VAPASDKLLRFAEEREIKERTPVELSTSRLRTQGPFCGTAEASGCSATALPRFVRAYKHRLCQELLYYR